MHIQHVPWHIWISERDHALRTCIFATSSNVFADICNSLSHCTVLYSCYSYHLPHILSLPLVYARTFLVPLIACRTVSRNVIVRNVKKKIFFWVTSRNLFDTFRIDLLLRNTVELSKTFVHCHGHSFPLGQRQSLSVKPGIQNRSWITLHTSYGSQLCKSLSPSTYFDSIEICHVIIH